jgi:hypothetical protein
MSFVLKSIDVWNRLTTIAISIFPKHLMEISDQRDSIPLRQKLFYTHHFCLKAKYRISLSVSLIEAVKGGGVQ